MKLFSFVLLLPSYAFADTAVNVTPTVSLKTHPILQYGIAGALMFFVVTKLIGLVKWVIDKKTKSSNNNNNNTARLVADILKQETNRDQKVYERINAVEKGINERINAVEKGINERIEAIKQDVEDIKLQQASLPGTLFQEFVTKETCKERRDSCPAVQKRS
jgi:hypothetical protein